MINFYDIAITKDGLPSLVKLNSYDMSINATMKNEGIGRLMRDYVRPHIYDNEHMFLIAFDYYRRAKGVFLLGIGDYKSCEISKRNVAECLVLSGAREFMIVHNHPDGNFALSESDYEFANDIERLANIFDIEFLGNYAATQKGIIGTKTKEPIYYDDLED